MVTAVTSAQEAYSFDCDAILADAKPVSFSFLHLLNYPPFRDKSYKIKIIEPADGKGPLYVIRLSSKKMTNPPALWKMAKAFPDFYAQFDISVSANNDLIFPSDIRLSALMKNGIRFKNIPPYLKQIYSTKYFEESLEDNTLPLATLEVETLFLGIIRLFFHDRIEEHMVALLSFPPWLFIKFKNFVNFEKAFFNSKLVKDYPQIKEFMREYYVPIHFFPSTTQWDTLTSQLGGDIKALPTALKNNDIGYAIHTIKKSLLIRSAELNPMDGRLMSDLGHLWRWKESYGSSKKYQWLTPEVFQKITDEIFQLAKTFQTEEITDQMAENEAINIVRDITKLSLEDLHKAMGRPDR